MENQTRSIAQWLALRDIPYSDLKQKLKLTTSHIEQGVTYQKLTGLTRLFNREANAARFYFVEQELILIYVISPMALANLSPYEIKGQFPEIPETLRSRTGKTAKHIVYPERGLAFSEDAGRVIFLEIFPPTDFETYLDKIYEEPEPSVL